MDDQKHLPYTCAFLQEVYRLGYVLPVNFLRCTLTDVEDCEGYRLNAGTRVIAQFQSVHVDKKHFPDPEHFNPDRFLNVSLGLKNSRFPNFWVYTVDFHALLLQFS